VTSTKVAERNKPWRTAPVELDMVLNIGQLRSGNSNYVRDDIKAVCDAAHARGAKVK